jgi:MFS family permease
MSSSAPRRADPDPAPPAGGTGAAPAVTSARRPSLLTPRFLAVTVVGLLYFTGWTLMYPVLPEFVEEQLGGSGAAVGLSVGIFGVTAALLRPVAGRLGDRRGRRLLVVGGMAIVTASMLGYLLVTSVAAAIGLRLLFGVGEAFAFVGLATAVQDMAPADRRGEAASYFSVAVYGGVAVGPPLGEALLGDGNFDRVWWFAAALVGVGALLGLLTPDGRSSGPPVRSGWMHPAAVLPGLALTGGLFGYAGFVSFVTLYAEDQLDLAGAGWVFTTYAVLILVVRVAGARLADQFGPLRVAAVSLVALGTGLLVVAAWASPVGLYAGVVVFSVGMALNFPALLAFVVNRASDADRAFAVASITMFFDVAFAAGAAVMGVIVALSSERWAFAAGGLCALAGLVPLAAEARRSGPTVAAGAARRRAPSGV